MTATTPHFEIPYPTTDDQIRLIPAQLQALATKVDTTMYGAGPRSGSTLADIDTSGTTTGQQAYVYKSSEIEMAQAGPYWRYAGEWIRPAQPAVIVQMPTNDNWAINSWQWQTFGQPYVFVRVTAKRDIVTTSSNRAWDLGTLTQSEYAPPAWLRIPACTNDEHTGDVCFRVGNTGLALETFNPGFTFKSGSIVFAMLTWPCPNVGRIRTFAQS